MLVKFTKRLDDTHEIRTAMCEHFEKVCKCDLCSVEVKPQKIYRRNRVRHITILLKRSIMPLGIVLLSFFANY